jgi:ribosomal protein S27E
MGKQKQAGVAKMEEPIAMYVTCPSCTNSTGWRQSDGSIRCIPCGRGLVPKGTPTLDKEDSKRAADFLSGKTNKFERTGK